MVDVEVDMDVNVEVSPGVVWIGQSMMLLLFLRLLDECQKVSAHTQCRVPPVANAGEGGVEMHHAALASISAIQIAKQLQCKKVILLGSALAKA